MEASTARVAVLIPPAVPTGEPPTNISSEQIRAPALVNPSWGMVANPAVRVVTDWNRHTCILSHRFIAPMVAGLRYSVASSRAAPPKISRAVVNSTILLCRVR